MAIVIYLTNARVAADRTEAYRSRIFCDCVANFSNKFGIVSKVLTIVS